MVYSSHVLKLGKHEYLGVNPVLAQWQRRKAAAQKMAPTTRASTPLTAPPGTPPQHLCIHACALCRF
eukprot:1608679-Pleurochrysis_carterae.AAC.4